MVVSISYLPLMTGDNALAYPQRVDASTLRRQERSTEHSTELCRKMRFAAVFQKAVM
jgi:hypothetical protein